MDVALAIEHILYGAKYFGCTNQNTKGQYDNELDWKDERILKPTWEEIEIAWNEIKDLRNYGIIREKTKLELLQEEVSDLKAKITDLENK